MQQPKYLQASKRRLTKLQRHFIFAVFYVLLSKSLLWVQQVAAPDCYSSVRSSLRLRSR